MPATQPPELLLALDSLETPALTKASLTELLFERIGFNKREAKEMVDGKLLGEGSFDFECHAAYFLGSSTGAT